MLWIYDGWNIQVDTHEIQLIGKVLNEAKYAWTLSSTLQEKIRSSYLFGFQFVPRMSPRSLVYAFLFGTDTYSALVFSAACNVIILPAVLLIREVRLTETA